MVCSGWTVAGLGDSIGNRCRVCTWTWYMFLRVFCVLRFRGNGAYEIRDVPRLHGVLLYSAAEQVWGHSTDVLWRKLVRGVDCKSRVGANTVGTSRD